MLGTLRLVLAVFVVISHAGVRWGGLNPGVIAVVGFYAISGYVMTGLVRRHYPRIDRLLGFYADRALRLLPAYYVVALAALAWFFWHGPEPLFLERSPTGTDLLNNLLVVPINFYMWNDADKFSLVPPAWSLGCEIQFYLLFPLLLLGGLRPLAFGLSLLVYLAAFSGNIQTEWFGYRLLPGVLFVFLLGSLLYDCHHADDADAAVAAGRGRGGSAAIGGCGTRITVLTVLGVLGFAAAGHWGGTVQLPYNPETLIGLGVAVPLLHLLAPRPGRIWDDRAGDLSYGVFLVHFLVFWFWPGVEEGPAALVLRVAAAMALAWGLHRFVEIPVLAWRRRLRRRSVTGPQSLT